VDRVRGEYLPLLLLKRASFVCVSLSHFLYIRFYFNLHTIVYVFTAVAQHVEASRQGKKPRADSSFKYDENPSPIDTT
jgi:hypothetical protein